MGVYIVVSANKMLSGYFGSIFFKFVSVIDFEDKVGKLIFKFLFAYAGLVEEMEDEFLWIRQFFPDGRQKGRLPISKLDN